MTTIAKEIFHQFQLELNKGYNAKHMSDIATYFLLEKYVGEFNKELRDFLIDLMTIGEGEEFEMSETEFKEFLEKLHVM